MEKIKFIKRQDSGFKLSSANSGETSLNLSNDIFTFISQGSIKQGEEKDITFKIYKEDCIKAMSFIIMKLPLYKTSSNDSRKLDDYLETFNELYSKIDDFFGNKNATEYKVSLLYRTDGRIYLKSLRVNGFSVRDYLVENYSALKFDDTDGSILNLRILSDIEEPEGTVTELFTPKELSRLPLQQIFYGAPGTGKSFEINRLTKNKEVIRTTFHPDSDYSTFVGAYKPTSVEVPVRDVTGKVIIENGQKVTENRIVYEFVEQAFLQAYIKAWKAYADIDAGETPEEQYLVIEEINRGNCAQIFGDLFQLLDRNKAGFSDYPITADKDMKKQLAKAFKDMTIADAARINSCYDKDIVSKVLSGDILLLPDNLYIWATMNTSDQSLFPIDSAFKRRWDWKYVPISEGVTETGIRLGYKLKVKGKLYNWWSFINKINNEIGELTKSEDKKLGYFFCKANGETIDAETFVSKVVFYLWNDVFKDQDVASIFSDGDEELTFSMFYDTDIYGKAIVKEDKVEVLLKNLGLEPIPATEEPSAEEMAKDDNTPLTVTLNGEVINEGTSSNTFVKVLQKIGLERLADKNIAGSVLVSKSGEESRVWRKVDDYFVYIGWWANYKKSWLQGMSKELGIDLTVK